MVNVRGYEIEQFFDRRWGLYKADLERVLNCIDSGGSGSNFSVNLLLFAALEQFAKLYAPFVGNDQTGYRIANLNNRLRSINAKHSVDLFLRRYFEDIDGRYSLFAKFIWDVFRNSHVHHFYPKKILDVPIENIDNSFLTGVHWPGRLSELVADNNLLNQARSEHLRFNINERLTQQSGVIRPVFIFVPHVFYIDLNEVVESFREDVENISYRRRLFGIGLRLLLRESRKSFPEDFNDTQSRRVLFEIRELVENY